MVKIITLNVSFQDEVQLKCRSLITTSAHIMPGTPYIVPFHSGLEVYRLDETIERQVLTSSINIVYLKSIFKIHETSKIGLPKASKFQWWPITGGLQSRD